MPKPVLDFLTGFRNSLGDITVPDLSDDKAGWKIQAFVVTFFTLFQFFMLVVLLNFLIAQVSQSYDEVVGQEERIIYRMKADFNKEVMAVVDTFSRPQIRGPLLYIRFPKFEEG